MNRRRNRVITGVMGTATGPAITPICSAMFFRPVIVTSAESAIRSMAPEEVRNIFQGKQRFLRNGMEIMPIDQAPTNPIRDRFYL